MIGNVTDATDKNHKHIDFYMLISNFRKGRKISKIKKKNRFDFQRNVETSFVV